MKEITTTCDEQYDDTTINVLLLTLSENGLSPSIDAPLRVPVFSSNGFIMRSDIKERQQQRVSSEMVPTSAGS